nr:adenosylcobinamide-phosphate synthase CbiB [uncultured Cohaesibacter sp.]
MILSGGLFAVVVLLALILDGLFGEPDWIWARLPHPVVLFGKAISLLEKTFNHPGTQGAFSGRALGSLSMLLLVGVGAVGGTLVQWFLMSLGIVGWIIIAILASTLLAQKSLYDHVKRVEEDLAAGDLERARYSVSMIVGRDTTKLNGSGVARAAIESLAENYSDGIVAPLFWLVLFGLPGLICYKIINTGDSMIGHRNERYRYFGWAAARMDDVLNLIPARLTMLLLLFSPMRRSVARAGQSQPWERFFADASRHRSPNAGWPEGAMARRLDIALSGPRYYGGELVDEPFVNDSGRRAIGARDVHDALRLYVRASSVQFAFVAIIALIAAL